MAWIEDVSDILSIDNNEAVFILFLNLLDISINLSNDEFDVINEFGLFTLGTLLFLLNRLDFFVSFIL